MVKPIKQSRRREDYATERMNQALARATSSVSWEEKAQAIVWVNLWSEAAVAASQQRLLHTLTVDSSDVPPQSRLNTFNESGSSSVNAKPTLKPPSP